MNNNQVTDAKLYKYSFDISIAKPADKVWSIMFDRINDWWMNDFRAIGEDSVMSLSAQTGGAMVETGSAGETLEWYRVQMCQPGKAVYLVGYIAQDWGGPTTSMLKVSLEPQGDNCTLTVSDALLGNVTESSAKSAEDGWYDMFTKGLKAHAES